MKVIVVDFSKDDTYGEIEEQLQNLNVGVLGQPFVFFFFFN